MASIFSRITYNLVMPGKRAGPGAPGMGWVGEGFQGENPPSSPKAFYGVRPEEGSF